VVAFFAFALNSLSSRATQVFQRCRTGRCAGEDWVSYIDRQKSFGEEAALRWAVNKLAPNVPRPLMGVNF
jgi:hypothetical protein